MINIAVHVTRCFNADIYLQKLHVVRTRARVDKYRTMLVDTNENFI